SLSNLQVPERLLCKQVTGDESNELDLRTNQANPGQMDDEFWQAYRTLDREQLFEDTAQLLSRMGRPLSIGELAELLPPSHDLETLSFWLAMAREAGVELRNQEQIVDLVGDDGVTRYFVPLASVRAEDIADLEAERLE
ncbi:MAG: DUF3375 family protein, partial [Planctomycetales bacterium]|nr:DUF3375 family protein [Planctomycetales bacterium]